MSHQTELEKKKYRNWVRGGLAYKYLKEGIKGFADDVVGEEHRRINQDVISGRTCNECSIRNLRPLHTCQKDHASRYKCPWGQNNCNCTCTTKKKRCPNKVCDAVMEEILKNHGSAPPTPNWKNIDIQKWCSDPWEMAKCFINAPGYADKSTADDIDIAGLLHVFINNIGHKTHLSDKINNGNIFLKTLQRRNELFHSPTMELEDLMLDKCIDDILAILEDEKELKARHDSQEAVLKLKQLKQENFIITTYNEVDVCRDALTSITNEKEELKQTIQDAKDDIAMKQSEATEAIGEETKKVLRAALGESDNQNETLYERVGRLESDHLVTKQRLTTLEGRADKLETIRQNHQKQLDYVEGKQALQNGLVKLYQQHYVKTSTSPLKSRENDISINEVYVSPQMAVKEQTTSNDGEDRKVQMRTPERKYIHGYHEIFRTKGQKHKAVYIVGDAGTGKSSFCKMMIQNWCTAFTDNSVNIVTGSKRDNSMESGTGATYEVIYTRDKELSSEYSCPSTSDTSDSEWSTVSTSESESDDDSQYSGDQTSNADDGDINEIRHFDFLFFVPLQNMSGLSDITEMIKAIVTDAGLASTDMIDGILEQESERCLIVADGLDEWTIPKDKYRLSHVSYGLPKRDRAKHATVITLSRPSAKGILNMKSSEYDKKVEFLGINIRSVKCFIEKYLSKSNNKGISSRPLMKKIKSAKLKHLEKTPLLLQQLVWLYCNGNEIGKSISDTNSHIINVMLGWTQNKEEEETTDEDQIGDTNEDKDEELPGMLHRFDRCEANKRFLLPLARVAFEAMTSKTGSNTFGRNHLRKRAVSNNCITTVIKLGLLVEENCFDPTKENTRLAFIHTSYLEFFAALHVSGQYNKDQRSVKRKTVLEELFRNCESTADILHLSNVFKMICGLSPYIVSDLSKMISDIVSGDENMITYRNFLSMNLRERSSEELEQVQRLMFDCLFEGDSDDKPMISLCDVIIDRNTEKSFLQRIIPENVLSLHADCWVFDVPAEMVLLSSFIQKAPLRCLSLCGVDLIQCEDHAIDLSMHDCCQVIMFTPSTNSNAEDLEILQLNSSDTLDIDLLLNSSMTEVQFETHSSYNFTYNKQVDSVVHTLRQLRKLRLEKVKIYTNALTVTPEMRNLEYIELWSVRMSLETWRTFIDSLLTLQQSVTVRLFSLFGIKDDEKFDYVRQNKMFEVTEENTWYFKFRTKK
ncbi:uncharacterized protein LOC128546095 [Mercenaria mercenaria]|uniref:uncharacterized protein LOC128546095 n=1 Tax=Mercenaria mercenaria TaxID=6596 RepID=UPI00234E6572|nr:uncharacterized protein LOC128546095 [Mercenaria mercenaria]XP_053402117.1 uncharacterized protein LOC128546095 [Mercenaria mercenaria]XP_053402118.1 uncharacterized protein LOC128546095 [Mercenaria mercenaria]